MKNITIILVLLSFIRIVKGQEVRNNFPNGFHIAAVGEISFSQKPGIIPLSSNKLVGKTGVGWLAGVEFSYHFAKYFGVYAGINYGTNSVIRLQFYDNQHTSISSLNINDLHIPIGIEFHQQIGNSNFSFVGNIGVDFYNFIKPITFISRTVQDFSNISLYDKNRVPLHVDLHLGAGFYYKLPYNDLLRFKLQANMSFKDHFKGEYITYNIVGSTEKNSAINTRNNHLGLEFAYIHCFRTKAQREWLKTSKKQ